jgi:polyisoprenoid-binding protein YceI
MITPLGDDRRPPHGVISHRVVMTLTTMVRLAVAPLAMAFAAVTLPMALLLDVAAQGPAAVPSLPGAPAAPPAPGEVDLDGSRVYVFVGKTGLGHDHAIVGRLVSGGVILDAAQNAGQLVFDMPSFLADTPEARKVLGLVGETDASTRKQTTENMLGPEVLDVARHPTATFDIDSALRSRRPGNGTKPIVDLVGTFTLHGVARKVVIPVEVGSGGRVLRLVGSFRIKQTEFGIKPYKKLGGVVGVADELVIHGDLRIAATPVAGAAADLTTPTAQPPAGRLPAEEAVPATIDGGR